MNPAADKVRQERLRRGWSVRRAANESGGIITNQWWGLFESGEQPLTQRIREAVAKAFGWPADWAETGGDRISELEATVEDLRARLEQVEKRGQPPAPATPRSSHRRKA